MIDSLVRVSRRVGRATDLLETDMGPVSVRDTRYTRPLIYPSPAKLEAGANHTQASGKLHPTAQSTRNGTSREATEKYSRRRKRQRQKVLADRYDQSKSDVSLNLRYRLRERVRLPLHSFTYS